MNSADFKQICPRITVRKRGPVRPTAAITLNALGHYCPKDKRTAFYVKEKNSQALSESTHVGKLSKSAGPVRAQSWKVGFTWAPHGMAVTWILKTRGKGTCGKFESGTGSGQDREESVSMCVCACVCVNIYSVIVFPCF